MRVYIKVEVHDINGNVHETVAELPIAGWSASKNPEGDEEVSISLENGGEIDFTAPDGWKCSSFT